MKCVLPVNRLDTRKYSTLCDSKTHEEIYLPCSRSVAVRVVCADCPVAHLRPSTSLPGRVLERDRLYGRRATTDSKAFLFGGGERFRHVRNKLDRSICSITIRRFQNIVWLVDRSSLAKPSMYFRAGLPSKDRLEAPHQHNCATSFSTRERTDHEHANADMSRARMSELVAAH